MAKIKGEIIIDLEACKGCELCVEACPQGALKKSEKVNLRGYQYVVKVKDACTGCATCALVCPEGGIRVYRKKQGEVKPVATISDINENITVRVKK